MTSATLASGRLDTVSTPAARPAYTDLLAASGRILIATVFILSGFGKIADPATTLTYIQGAGLPLPQIALAAAIVIEAGGGLALVSGIGTRVVATALALFSLVTAFAFHGHLADQNQFIHFFKNIAITGGLLQVIAFGPGRIAFDRV